MMMVVLISTSTAVAFHLNRILIFILIVLHRMIVLLLFLVLTLKFLIRIILHPLLLIETLVTRLELIGNIVEDT